LLGASFITEGAVPFAAADPLRGHPSVMLGSATAGVLSIVFGATPRAPHGGVFVLPLVGEPLLFVVALVAGTLISAVAVVLPKQLEAGVPRSAETAAEATAMSA
jgi:PTS system fructose-specific IIC component